MESTIFNLDPESRKLRDILESMADTDAAMIENGGEITPELEELMAIDANALARKVDGYCAVARSFDSKIAAIDAEAKRLAVLKKHYQNAKDRLLNNLEYQMDRFGLTEIQGELARVNFRKSTAVEVDEDVLIAPYLPEIGELQSTLPKYITLGFKIGKKEVGDALAAGDDIPEGGAAKVEHRNIQLK